MLVGLAFSAPAFAQTTPATPAAPAVVDCKAHPDNPACAEDVVVTGSRIRVPSTFSSPDPIQTITAEESSLRGFIDTAQIIQSATVAGNGTQINNFFTGFVVNGGPGVNTVSLRGLGTDRTLVLLDGQRMGPAGVSGTVGSVDLNTIPSTIIDHIDILKDGSSSIYGSDAVAGVVNIVTKKSFDGGEFHIYVKPFTEGGNEYDASGSYGKTFNRGYITGSFDIYRQDALRDGQRSYLDCSKSLATNASTGASLDLTDPVNGGDKCFNILSKLVIDPFTGAFYVPASSAAPGAYTGGDVPGYHQVGQIVTNPDGSINVAATRLQQAEVPYNEPFTLRDTAVSPVTRYTITNGLAYDLFPNRVQFYNNFLFNQRLSEQTDTRQVFPILYPGNPGNGLSGVPGTSGFAEPVVLTPFDTQQKVDYYRDVLGFRGDLPNWFTLKNLHYDLDAQYSMSKGTYTTDIVYWDRLNAASAPGGCNPNFVNGFEGGPSMVSLGDTATCVPINWTQDAFNGTFSPQELKFLTGTDTGHTTYEQAYIQGDVSGDLLELPAGPLGFDAGFHVRRDRIHDQPGPETLEGNSWGLSSAGVTEGSQQVGEFFGEFLVPVVKNLPFVENLSLHVSGRYSDYNTVGDAKTYKAGVDWKITDFLSLKYVQGTSFRAPQLYELYLADLTGYYGQLSVDPCIDYVARNEPANVQKNCAAPGVPGNYGGAGPSVLVYSGGGIGNLAPETSLSRTISLVFQPHWFGLNAGVQVDYYENHIRNGIQQFGPANILYSCYDSSTYPNDGFCKLFTRDTNPNSPTYQNILDVYNNYVNVANVLDRGLDVTLYYVQKLPYDVRFRFDSQLSWTFQESTLLLPGTPSIDYNGTVGTPSFVGNMSFRFDWHTWTFNWFVNMVGHSSDNKFLTLPINFEGTGVAANIVDYAPFYTVSTISVRKRLGPDLTITAGISNLFDIRPPDYSVNGYDAVLGTFPLSSQYDIYGRSGFIQLDKKF